MQQPKINIYEEAILSNAELSTWRLFLKQCGMGLGAVALSQLLGSCVPGGSTTGINPIQYDPNNPMMPRPPHFPGKAKAVIYLHMAGAPSPLDQVFPQIPQTQRWCMVSRPAPIIPASTDAKACTMPRKKCQSSVVLVGSFIVLLCILVRL